MRFRVTEAQLPAPALPPPQLPKIKLMSTAPSSYAIPIPKIVLPSRCESSSLVVTLASH